MIVARFRARLPDGVWVGDVSREYPDAEFRLLSGIRAGDTAVELGEVVADDIAALERDIADHGSVIDFETVERTDGRLLARYETTDVDLYGFLSASSVPAEFPVVVCDGWYELDVTGTREEFDAVRAALEASGREYELLSLVHGESDSGLLTDRQAEVLDTALRAGYFETPRECTLADLADRLDVDKSTASRVVRRGQTRVLQRYLTSTDRSAGR